MKRQLMLTRFFGRMWIESGENVVHDGGVMHFRFNV
jgi:hypothetical protein